MCAALVEFTLAHEGCADDTVGVGCPVRVFQECLIVFGIHVNHEAVATVEGVFALRIDIRRTEHHRMVVVGIHHVFHVEGLEVLAVAEGVVPYLQVDPLVRLLGAALAVVGKPQPFERRMAAEGAGGDFLCEIVLCHADVGIYHKVLAAVACCAAHGGEVQLVSVVAADGDAVAVVVHLHVIAHVVHIIVVGTLGIFHYAVGILAPVGVGQILCLHALAHADYHPAALVEEVLAGNHLVGPEIYEAVAARAAVVCHVKHFEVVASLESLRLDEQLQFIVGVGGGYGMVVVAECQPAQFLVAAEGYCIDAHGAVVIHRADVLAYVGKAVFPAQHALRRAVGMDVIDTLVGAHGEAVPVDDRVIGKLAFLGLQLLYEAGVVVAGAAAQVDDVELV